MKCVHRHYPKATRRIGELSRACRQRGGDRGPAAGIDCRHDPLRDERRPLREKAWTRRVRVACTCTSGQDPRAFMSMGRLIRAPPIRRSDHDGNGFLKTNTLAAGPRGVRRNAASRPGPLSRFFRAGSGRVVALHAQNRACGFSRHTGSPVPFPHGSCPRVGKAV